MFHFNQLKKPKRRWHQFSLRTLLIVITLFTVTVAWTTSRMQRARRNRDRVAAVEKAVAAIEKLGESQDVIVEVASKYKELRSQTFLEKLFDDSGGPDDPVGVLEITRVLIVSLSAGDADLKHLQELKNLRELVLIVAQLTDAGLEHLEGLQNLQELYFFETQITVEGVKKLQQTLPNCEIFHAE